ncbi:unnamed protein product [Penicillium salamii]|nr:unnamed protein product [Penicillium salamii]
MSDRLSLWQCLFWLASKNQFCIPSIDGISSCPVELPLLILYNYSESFEEELLTLEHPRAEFQVISGFTQQLVFLAFFCYFKTDSESHSFTEDSLENNNISVNEFLIGISNPDEIIPNPFTMLQKNIIPLPSVLAIPQFDPILEKQNFYIYFLDNPIQGINKKKYYLIYFKNLLLKLHIKFIGEESFITILYQSEEESNGTIKRKRQYRDDFFKIGEIKRWLDERLNRLLSVNHVSQFTIPPPH